MSQYEWVVRILPPMPKHMSERALMKLSKRELVERCWASSINADESMQSAAEAWARTAELVEMIEGRRRVNRSLIRRLKEHRAHVIKCQAGSCEHEYAALVRVGLVPEPPGATPAGGA